jgi:NADH-quinone oxidoreductase subunit H
MWSFSKIANLIHEWLNQTFNPTVATDHRNGNCRDFCDWFICNSWIGTRDHGKKSFCLDTDTPWAKPGWTKRNVSIMADTVKLLVKEAMTPSGADKFLFNLAPYIAMMVAMLLMAPTRFCQQFSNVGPQYRCIICICGIIH